MKYLRCPNCPGAKQTRLDTKVCPLCGGAYPSAVHDSGDDDGSPPTVDGIERLVPLAIAPDAETLVKCRCCDGLGVTTRGRNERWLTAMKGLAE